MNTPQEPPKRSILDRRSDASKEFTKHTLMFIGTIFFCYAMGNVFLNLGVKGVTGINERIITGERWRVFGWVITFMWCALAVAWHWVSKKNVFLRQKIERLEALIGTPVPAPQTTHNHNYSNVRDLFTKEDPEPIVQETLSPRQARAVQEAYEWQKDYKPPNNQIGYKTDPGRQAFIRAVQRLMKEHGIH